MQKRLLFLSIANKLAKQKYRSRPVIEKRHLYVQLKKRKQSRKNSKVKAVGYIILKIKPIQKSNKSDVYNIYFIQSMILTL